MISYQDRTFCNKPCGTNNCTIKYTPEVSHRAQACGLPVAVADRSHGCGWYTEPTEEDTRDDG